MSLAQVSDISVISLPLAASELANAIHYPCTSTIPRQALVGHTPPEKDTVIIEPRHHFYERRSNPELASVKEIVILGQQVFLIALHGDDYVMVYEMFLNRLWKAGDFGGLNLIFFHLDYLARSLE